MLEVRSDTFSVFRDDLFPFLGGGNKARKMMALHSEIKNNNYRAIVTTGGIQSNHCRAVALYCLKYNIDCTLILHGSRKDFFQQSGNAKIMRNTPARLIFCNPEEISNSMDNACKFYTDIKKKPFYIPGGGHIIKASASYIEVVNQIVSSGYVPDLVFVASGTGSTHAGILAGLSKYKLQTKLYGISVGRTKERGHKIVEDFYKQLCIEYDIKAEVDKVNFSDKYLCGGYGKYNDDIKRIEENSIIEHNLFLDKTYTAKVFHAMEKIVENEGLNQKVLFWYTGGIFNYLA